MSATRGMSGPDAAGAATPERIPRPDANGANIIALDDDVPMM